MKTAEEILMQFYEVADTHQELSHKSSAYYIRGAAEMSGHELFAKETALKAMEAYHAQFADSDAEKEMKFKIEELPEGCFDLDWLDEMYNAFCDMYHDDGSNDDKMKEKMKKMLLDFLHQNSSPSLASTGELTDEEIEKAAIAFAKKCDPLNQTLEKQADIRFGFIESAKWARDEMKRHQKK